MLTRSWTLGGEWQWSCAHVVGCLTLSCVWYRHIVLSTADHSVNSGLLKSFYCYAGLNYHILHHLFPTVDHSRLKQLDPVFRQTMKEFNIPYRTFTFRELFAGVFRRHDMAPIGNLIHPAPQD